MQVIMAALTIAMHESSSLYNAPHSAGRWGNFRFLSGILFRADFYGFMLYTLAKRKPEVRTDLYEKVFIFLGNTNIPLSSITIQLLRTKELNVQGSHKPLFWSKKWQKSKARYRLQTYNWTISKTTPRVVLKLLFYWTKPQLVTAFENSKIFCCTYT